jgi:hypothetical protein
LDFVPRSVASDPRHLGAYILTPSLTFTLVYRLRACTVSHDASPSIAWVCPEFHFPSPAGI